MYYPECDLRAHQEQRRLRGCEIRETKFRDVEGRLVMKRFGCAIGYSIVCLSLLASGHTGGDRNNRSHSTSGQEEKSAQQRRGEQGETRSSAPQPNIAFAVSNDQPLTYPDSFYWLPDEHTTIMPATALQNYLPPPGQPGPHDFFVAMSNCVAPGVKLRPRRCDKGTGKLYGGA